MNTIDAETVMAFVDGELDELGAARVARAMAEDPALAARIDAERRLKARLASHYAPILDAAVPERLTALFDTRTPAPVPTPVTDLAEARAKRRPAAWIATAMAMAACLLLGLFLGRGFDLPGSGPKGEGAGTALIAEGRLATALDTQLASAQPADAAIRIGLSFHAQDGALCRTFSGEAIEGIACRSGAHWQLRRTASDPETATRTAYRQAASGELMAAAQAMMAGEPLDAAGEQAARAGGWR